MAKIADLACKVKGSSSALKNSRVKYELHGALSQLTDTSFVLRSYTY
jgi:hypothetical protein